MGPPTIWTLESSHRLTPRISLHSFSNTDLSNIALLPSGKVTLQFPPNLDPITTLSEDERRLVFTPCRATHDASGRLSSFAFLASNGRVAGLIGLPRQLTARLVDVGDGFPSAVLSSRVCVAGGTGIACFLALGDTRNATLVWSIRGDDFAIVESFLATKMLDVGRWSSVRVFVTPGEDVDGLAGGKPAAWWQARFETLRAGGLELRLGRMAQRDLDALLGEGSGDVLFCGSKALEWQVKMWSLGRAVVHCTER
ncbi:hypothetical protein QQX98_009121 [Neonectria punicea]|uniref:FAD-binding FR-type domain-containing protein n=1 Tax=Neonectria punicea TaxID=979145 RepID=A0ABR1GT85_9HYPO